MTLSIVHTSHAWAPNTIDDTIDSADSADSPSWRVSNLVGGTLVNLGTGTNTSDVGYNRFTKRFMFIRNNTESFTEISESDIVNSVASPTLIRVVTFGGFFGDDSEGISDVYQNLSEGGYEMLACIENGGRNLVYFVPITESEMFSTSPITITARQELTMAAVGADNNSGAEGVDYHITLDQIMQVQEGEQASTDRAVFHATRPTNRDTDYAYTDAELTVTEPFDAETIVPSGSDLSSCVYHRPTGHLLLLSDTGNKIYQYDTSGTLIDELALTGMFQPEGICMHGDNMVVMGEVDECKYYTYTP